MSISYRVAVGRGGYFALKIDGARMCRSIFAKRHIDGCPATRCLKIIVIHCYCARFCQISAVSGTCGDVGGAWSYRRYLAGGCIDGSHRFVIAAPGHVLAQSAPRRLPAVPLIFHRHRIFLIHKKTSPHFAAQGGLLNLNLLKLML